MVLSGLVLGSVLAAAPVGETVSVATAFPDEPVEVGREYEIDVRVVLADGWSASEAGLPKMFLQLDVPPSIVLSGEVLEGRTLMRNGFVRAPWERLIDPGSTSIKFRVESTPAPEARLGINVVGYLKSNAEPDDAWLIRRRVHLPIRSGAESMPTAPEISAWGGERQTAQIGEAAPEIRLPRADGSEVALSGYRGRKNVIITTYRAHW